MKVNLPVTDHEVLFGDEVLIVSRTDLSGVITYVNRDFITVSGFSDTELVGKNHNVVRHPDMPSVVYEDFWETIKAGKPWTGIVKNRCKNGDYYWVEANVSPVFERGQIVGYLSVRTKPTRAAIEQATGLYKTLNEGSHKHLQVREGRVQKTGILSRLNLLNQFMQRASLSTKFATAGVMLLIPLLVALFLLGATLKEGVDVAKLEKVGSHYHANLRKIEQELINQRGVLTLIGMNASGAREQWKEHEGTMQSVIKVTDAADLLAAPMLDMTKEWQSFRAQWEKARDDFDKGGNDRASIDRALADFASLTNKVVELMGDVGDKSGLILDPEAESYFLMSGAMVNGVELVRHLDLVRSETSLALLKNNLAGPMRDEVMYNFAYLGTHRDDMQSDFQKAFSAAPNREEEFGAAMLELTRHVKKFGEALDERVLQVSSAEISSRAFFDLSTQAIEQGFVVYDKALIALNNALDNRIARLTQRGLAIMFASLFIFAIGASVAYIFVRRTTHSLFSAVSHFSQIAQGNFRNRITVSSDDEVGALMRGLKAMQTKIGFDVNETRERTDSALRIKIGLDSVSTNVMIADNDYAIIYMNPAITQLLRLAQEQLRRGITGFDVDRLMGSSLAHLHANTPEVMEFLPSLNATRRVVSEIGGLSFALAFSPVLNERGERLGTVVEWVDRTVEVAVEQEVNTIVGAAAGGDFSQRIEVRNKTGFFRALSDGINKVVDTSDAGLKDIARVLEALAKGDLTQRISAEYQGTFADLKRYSNDTVDSLREMMSAIRESSETINTAAGEIAAGNGDLSSRTEEQAASLEETASSMEEFSSTVKQNADNARQANKLAEGASEVAVRGGQVVERVVTTMAEINDSARKIVDIIGVIDGIAFQTNILALNAAVEAARAGEQGRGFAVVAGEVRSLAQRSAAAAKEIKALIGDSVDKVEGGNKLVSQAGETMNEVVVSIRRVTDIMNEISAASSEQSSGIDQVSRAVTQMDETTQQNAALVEQAAASAEAMSGQASSLLEIVRRFKLAEHESASAATQRLTHSAAPAAMLASSAPKPKKMTSKSSKPAKISLAATADDDEDWSEF